MSSAGGNQNRLPFKTEGQEWYSGQNHAGRVFRGYHLWDQGESVFVHGLSIEMTVGASYDIHIPIIFSVSVAQPSYITLLEDVTPDGDRIFPYMLNRYVQAQTDITGVIDYPIFYEHTGATPGGTRTLFEQYFPVPGVYPVRPDPAFGRQYWVLDTSVDYWLAIDSVDAEQDCGVYWDYMYLGDQIPWYAPV